MVPQDDQENIFSSEGNSYRYGKFVTSQHIIFSDVFDTVSCDFLLSKVGKPSLR